MLSFLVDCNINQISIIFLNLIAINIINQYPSECISFEKFNHINDNTRTENPSIETAILIIRSIYWYRHIGLPFPLISFTIEQQSQSP